MLKNTVKLFSLVLVFVMLVSLASCTSKLSVSEWVAENGADLEAQMDAELGGGFKVYVLANGYDLYVKMHMVGVDDLEEGIKDSLKENWTNAFDASDVDMSVVWDEVEDLGSIIYQLCEDDGDVIAEWEIKG